MKKILLIALTLLLLLTVPALCAASEAIDYEAQDAAEALHKLGLFSGTGTAEDGTPIYSLQRVPTRAEAVVMLVKLLGKDEKANAKEWKTPFTDVDDWAKPYVGYAYNKGYTVGTGATTFGSSDPVTAQQFLTFLLKALNYTEGEDFLWSEASQFTDELGITAGQYNESAAFTRGDVAKLSVKALQAEVCGLSITLLDNLQKDDVITKAEADTFLYEACSADFSSSVQYNADGSFCYTGSGEGSVRHMDFPAGQYYCECEYTGEKTFRADLYYDRESTDYWMIGSLLSKGTCYTPLYQKYFLYDMAGEELTDAHIEINADGPWVIRFKPFTDMEFNGKISGKGNYVSGLFTADADNYVIHATHNGSTLFHVQLFKYDPEDGLDFYRNAIEDYGSKEYKDLLNLEKGSRYYFSVIADGDWTIELGQTSVLSKTTKIDSANHVYSGEGNELITGISLPEGQWYAECSYTETRSGIARGFEGKMFFDIPGKRYWSMEGSASGSSSAFLNKTVLFDLKGAALENGALKVSCNGKWTVTFKQVQTTAKTSFSGKGAYVTNAAPASGETIKIKFTYNGADDYRVRMTEYETTSRSTRAQIVFEGSGSCSETKEFSVTAGKHYYFAIDGSGTWSLEIR